MPERKRRRKAGGRRKKLAAREQGAVNYRPYIERKIPYFEILDEEGLASYLRRLELSFEIFQELLNYSRMQEQILMVKESASLKVYVGS